MSRQDANAVFARTSFLYGGNAAYIEDLYAKFESDPAAVDAEWREFFTGLKDPPADVEKSARGASWQKPNWPLRPNGDLVAALDGQWAETEKRIGEKISAKAQAKGVEISSTDVQQATRDSIHALMLIRAYRMRGHFHAKLDPLGIQAGAQRGRARSALLRLHRSRHGPPHLPRQGARPRIRVDARDRRHPAPHLLPDARRGVHAHLQRRAERLDPGAHRRPRQGDQLHPRRQARHPQQAGGSGRLREIPRRQIHRHQALRPRRRRVADPGARADHQARRQSRREGNRARHAASRPPQRAHAGDGQAAPRAVPRIQGRLVDAGRDRRLRRREISPRRLVGPRVRRQQSASVARRQSVASGDRRSGDARQGARQAGPARRHAGRTADGDAAADARRRRLRRPGRGGGMLRPVGSEGLPHRRFDPFHRQQPDRLHHLSALFALVALSVRRRQDDRGADLPRQRRRSGSGHLRRQGRDRVPAEIPAAGGHRHVLLPALRPQRRRRAVVHPAADVPEDPLASDHAGNLRARS